VLTKMSRGAWVYTVPHEAPGKSGWVWRKFIDCSPPVPKLPEDIEIAWRCDGMIIAIVEKQLEGVSEIVQWPRPNPMSADEISAAEISAAAARNEITKGEASS
jgi:hypothetical protein